MIFRVKKALFNEIDDYAISSDGFFVKVAKLIKGYYLYGSEGQQVGQIIFEKGKATVVAVDSAALCVYKNADGTFGITENTPGEAEAAALNKSCRKQASQYMIYGQAAEYRYDIYEKASSAKRPLPAANIITDIQSKDYYKIRVQEGGNILKLIMLAIAIDKLNVDPDCRF
ncbi:MAG: hypothetical protein PHC84_01885 [Clostridia bacterium]|nr:hypothetical protein [Clostridia bacterium]